MLFHCIHLILYPTAYDLHTTVRRLLSLIDYHNMLNEFLQWKRMCLQSVSATTGQTALLHVK